MRHIKLISSCIALCATAIALFGCSDDATNDSGTPPKELRPGQYNASRHVALGVSLTAGFMNGSLYTDAQQGGQKHSYDYLLAKAVHGASTDDLFKVPAFGNPGLGGALFDTTVPGNVRLISNRVELTGVSGAGTPITRTNLSTANLNPDGLTTLNRPYNNLGIPGSLAADILSDNPFGFGTGRQSPFYQFIFRNQALGSNGVQQAINLMRAQPDSLPKLVTVWTGANEVLGFVTSGGVTQIYPFNAFQAQYDTILARLKAGIPNVKIIVFNIPNVASIPFATFLGPNARAVATQRGLSRLYYAKGNTIDSVATGDIGDVTKFMVLLPSGAGVAAIGDNTDGVKGVLWRTLLASINNTRAIQGLPTLNLQQLTANFTGGAGVDTTKPIGSRENPFPDQFTLDQAEINQANAAVNQYNTFINGKNSQANGIFVVDIAGLFDRVVSQGITSPDGEELRATFLTGGIFTIDGVHPGPKGHAIVANQMIPIIEREFNASIPAINTRNLPDGIYRVSPSSAVNRNGLASEEFLKQFTPQTLMPTIQAVGGHY
ncbi:MAG: SGNH/GDSL hydrolase family protein [Chloroherpetonaceae bacterium]